MKKRLIMSLSLLVLALSVGIAGTRALLSDSVTLTTNTFSTGTVDLQIGPSLESPFAETLLGFTDTLNPGQNVDKFFYLKNNSVGTGLSIVAQATNPGGTIATTDVTITFTPVNELNVPVGAAVAQTLAAWITTPSSLGFSLSAGATQRLRMNVAFSSGISASGASAIFDILFTGTQVL